MNDDALTDDLKDNNEIEDEDLVTDPPKTPIADPEEDHESLDALADEEDELDFDEDEKDSF